VWRGLGAGLLLVAGLARADTNFVTVQPQTVTSHFEAYARVEPVAVLPVRAAQTGVVTQLEVLAGARVQAGQKLAELGGPEIAALLAHDESALQSARTNLAGTQKSLEIQRQELTSHLSTRQSVLQTEDALAQAQARLDTAQARLQALHESLTVEASANGIVLAVNAANGERVAAGQILLTVQPADKLWLKAAYYGSDAAAIHVGMTGQFAPADGGKTVAVKVSTVFGALAPDGGESVGLVATTPSPGWLNGESGTVTLDGPTRSLVAVPTRALILDQGRWWLLVRTDQGYRPQAVVPGPTRGWQTFIERGLEPGAEVLVENAYLEFHRRIARHYQPQD
jgi:RND family efflux transporter MFP subunit